MGLFRPKNSQKGQILLIVVLAAVVSLTVGLSAVSRTITNTSVTTEEANSQKALSAAEAGVEELIKDSTPANLSKPDFSSNTGFDATVDPQNGLEVNLNGKGEVLKDDGVDLWLTTHPNFGGTPWTGNLDIYWKDNNGCNPPADEDPDPALEIVIISGANRNSPNMTRTVVDRCGRSGFSTPSAPPGSLTVDGVTYDRGTRINISQGYIARIIPLFANTFIGVRGSANFPIQGYVIDSVGTSGNTKRRVRVFKGFPKVPVEYFPYNLFLP